MMRDRGGRADTAATPAGASAGGRRWPIAVVRTAGGHGAIVWQFAGAHGSEHGGCAGAGTVTLMPAMSPAMPCMGQTSPPLAAVTPTSASCMATAISRRARRMGRV